MEITQCLHVAILVSDLAKAEQFYSNILGLHKIERNLNYPGAWYQVGQFQLHLIVHPHLTIQRHNWEKWGRNPHVAFAANHLDEVKQRLQAEGSTSR